MMTRKHEDNIINRPNGSYELTIVGFEDDYSFVRFNDGSFLTVAGNYVVSYFYFWRAFFTPEQYDYGIPRCDLDKLVGTNVRIQVFDKPLRSGKTVRATTTTKI